MVRGDFTIVLHRSKRFDEQYSRSCAEEFMGIMDRLDLIDLSLWEVNRHDPIK